MKKLTIIYQENRIVINPRATDENELPRTHGVKVETGRQTIQPSDSFHGDYKGLAVAISNDEKVKFILH